MFDRQKLRQLEQRSHVRGLLSKQFFHNDQVELQRKRREMKMELDRQVEERRRQKQQERMQQERRIRKEEEQIKNYYKNLQTREGNDSKVMRGSGVRPANQLYQTYPVNNQQESRYKSNLPPVRPRGGSKPSLVHQPQIGLMPVMPADNNPQYYNSNQSNTLVNSKQVTVNHNYGNIPLLDLSEEANYPPAKAKKSKKTTKREKTLQTLKDQSLQKQKMPTNRQELNSNYQYVGEQRRSTLQDEDSMVGSIVHAVHVLHPNQKRQTQMQEIKEEIEVVQSQNRVLKNELKKSQEALSLLIGAVRTNVKLDKYRVQAEKILSAGMQQSIVSRKETENKESKVQNLPKISFRQQSILHDYLISASRRNKKVK